MILYANLLNRPDFLKLFLFRYLHVSWPILGRATKQCMVPVTEGS